MRASSATQRQVAALMDETVDPMLGSLRGQSACADAATDDLNRASHERTAAELRAVGAGIESGRILTMPRLQRGRCDADESTSSTLPALL
jgi:hypothetical protein